MSARPTAYGWVLCFFFFFVSLGSVFNACIDYGSMGEASGAFTMCSLFIPIYGNGLADFMEFNMQLSW